MRKYVYTRAFNTLYMLCKLQLLVKYICYTYRVPLRDHESEYIYTIFKRGTALLGGSCLPEAGLRCFVNIYICVKWIVLLVWFLLWGRVLSTVVNASTISIYAKSMQVGWRREILKYRLLGGLSKSRQVGERREILIEKLLATKLGKSMQVSWGEEVLIDIVTSSRGLGKSREI